MLNDDVEFSDYEQLDEDSDEDFDFIETEEIEIEEEPERGFYASLSNFFNDFSLMHPFYSFLLDEFYVFPTPMISAGIINFIYGILICSGSIGFINYLNRFNNWFNYSLCFLFLLLSLNYFLAYLLKKKKGTLQGYLRGRSLFYFLLALFVFLFPNAMTAFILGAVGFLMLLIGLRLILKNYAIHLITRKNLVLERILGSISFLIGMILIFLPLFSTFYYHIAVAVIISLRGLIQIVIALYYRHQQLIEKSITDGFTDYMIE